MQWPGVDLVHKWIDCKKISVIFHSDTKTMIKYRKSQDPTVILLPPFCEQHNVTASGAPPMHLFRKIRNLRNLRLQKEIVLRLTSRQKSHERFSVGHGQSSNQGLSQSYKCTHKCKCDKSIYEFFCGTLMVTWQHKTKTIRREEYLAESYVSFLPLGDFSVPRISPSQYFPQSK